MNHAIPTGSASSKDDREPGARADTLGSDFAQAPDILDKAHSDEANPARPTAGVDATNNMLADNKVDLEADRYPIWWRGTETPPPASWAYTFEEFTGDDSADAWASAAAVFIAQVRRQTSTGPTFAELFAHLLPDTNGLPGQFPAGLNYEKRQRAISAFRRHSAIDWRRRAIIGWEIGIARSLRTGRKFRWHSPERPGIDALHETEKRTVQPTQLESSMPANEAGWHKKEAVRTVPQDAPEPETSDAETKSVRFDPPRHLAEAVASLVADPEYFIQILTNILRSTRSNYYRQISRSEVRAYIESGKFSSKEWAEISVSVDRDSLQLSKSEDWVMNIFDIMSIEDAASHLEWDERFIHVAVTAGQLYAVEASGRLRFPIWQFVAGSPVTLLRQLPELIKALNERQWQSAVGLMRTPHRSLVAKGQMTPTQWLRNGGDIDDVIRIIVMSDLEGK